MQFLSRWLGDDAATMNDRRTGAINNLDKLFLIAIGVIGAVLYMVKLNYLLVDPWESHYSQVTWETIRHGAFFRLWYQGSNHFWSKPPLLFWLQMPFIATLPINEFVCRLPIVIFSIGVLSGAYLLLSRLFTRKMAAVSAFVLMLSPMYFQLSRQVMVDLPFIGLNFLAILCIALYFFGDLPENDTVRIGIKRFALTMPRRDLFLYLFYFFEGWGFLAKGLLSLIIPATAFLIYLLISGDFAAFFAWRNLKKHLLGVGVYLLVGGPWFFYVWADAGWDFVNEFIIYHHFKRVQGEIHKPNDLWTLYPRVLGYALFPWIAFIPMALYRFFHGDRDTGAFRLRLFLLSAFIGPFFFLAFSSTKFWHYIAPVVPILAVMVGYYLTELWNAKWGLSRKLEVLTALFFVGIVARDIGDNFMVWMYMVTFYQERKGPTLPAFIPVMAVIFVLFGAVMLAAMFSERFKKWALGLVFVLPAAFMIYFFVDGMPKIATWYSYKPLWDAYVKDSPERAPIAQYYKWLEKSLSFWSFNEITFLASDKEQAVLRFFDRPGVQYAIVKSPDKNRFENIMKRVNKKTTVVAKIPQNFLYKVYGGDQKSFNNKEKYIIQSVPEEAVKVGAVFDNAVELVGYRILQGDTTPKENDLVRIEVYFKALRDNIPRDYTVFVHVEGDQRDKRTKDDQPMAMGEYPTTFWKKGDIVKHPINVRIPTNNKNNYYWVLAGIYQEDIRANISNPRDVEHDGDNRLKLVKLDIER
ncbi:MAG TPA: glycosyltransferase family 39 protein [bacterium]|nr:glycosyltransferase family 39 protein [bacterium]